MDLTWQQIADIAIATLSPEEYRQSAVYLLPRLLEGGETITVNRRSYAVVIPRVMAFVDLVPAANWGHPCRYLLIAPDPTEVQTIDAQFPPAREELRLVHRGSEIADWMLLTNQHLGTASS